MKSGKERIAFESDMNLSLANAIRRSLNKIEILAIDEVDIYKNDSALYDQIIAHRMGLVPLKNQKIKKGQKIELKLKAKGDGLVLSSALGDIVVYGEIPIVSLGKEQELEVVAKCGIGIGKDHAKYCPGLIYYRVLPKIVISSEGEKNKELANLYPKVFEFDGKLKIKNEFECDLDSEDVSSFKGIEIKPTEKIVMFIESWGQILAKEIFTESIIVLQNNLNDLLKVIK